MEACIYIGMVECSCKAHKAADGTLVGIRGQVPPDDICTHLVAKAPVVIRRGRQRGQDTGDSRF